MSLADLEDGTASENSRGDLRAIWTQVELREDVTWGIL